MNTISNLKTNFSKCSLFLDAISSNIRQDILIELAEIYPKGKRIKDFNIKKCLTRPTMSFHLKLLYKAGIVSYYSEGTKHYYFLSVSPDILDNISHLFSLLRNYKEVSNDSSN